MEREWDQLVEKFKTQVDNLILSIAVKLVRLMELLSSFLGFSGSTAVGLILIGGSDVNVINQDLCSSFAATTVITSGEIIIAFTCIIIFLLMLVAHDNLQSKCRLTS